MKSIQKPIKHIIVQAGGEGTRMQWHTKNKPKALVPVGGEPMILRLMAQHPEAKFYIRASYKADILEAYLGKFGREYDYKIITTEGEGTCAGLKQVLGLLPESEPLAIVWCDLYLMGDLYPSFLNYENANFIGLSNTFPCRWSFDGKYLNEAPSEDAGIAGLFTFKSKRELKNIPVNGEFCRFLQKDRIKFKPFFLKDVHEVGTVEAYERLTEDMPNVRPFNRMIVGDDYIIKKPINAQGEQLAKREENWYKVVAKHKISFVPKVISTSPLKLQKLRGNNLFKLDLTHEQKKQILSQHIDHLKVIHGITINVPRVDILSNDYKALLGKTKERLDSIADLVPFSQDENISINGRSCRNTYVDWAKIERLSTKFLGKSNYRFIHGDPTFSNTIYDEIEGRVYLIDPRGYYGDIELAGDPDYDWAKLYYSVRGNYDQFNEKNFKLDLSEGRVELEIASSGWEDTVDHLIKLTGANEDKIKFVHAIIWLSLTTYAWDNYDSICGAFYNGIYLMQELIDK